MNGHGYSWYTIAYGLQARHRHKCLRLEHFEPGNIAYEWNVLCDERLAWKYHGRPSFMSVKFNRACLVNLKTIPNRAGLGFEAQQMTENNIDRSFCFPIDMNLTVGKPDYAICDGRFGGGEKESMRLKLGYFYHEGPQFRVDYIHERVEY
ncbi:hypothetical protein OCU04_004407 [Sclerotinia nivalis]|uniref:Uncharacterized protein n=1 Tax=Sclerotinia nivalis TaxID=352851 RepID=A0A9X0AQD5_9HELO|nr:hypothetical protein OCU04_004407 [Sclerotinia nivalis]